MKTFIYSHTQGTEGKLTEKATKGGTWNKMYDTQGPVPWSNGQEVREDEFVLTEEFDTPMVTAPGLVHNGVRRIIAVPLSEKMEGRTQDELWEEVENLADEQRFICRNGDYCPESFNINPFLKELKSKYIITRK